MKAPILARSRRTRSTPFSIRVDAAGISGYTVYNHMLLPAFFNDVMENYHHLKKHVQVWDVSCERQVEIKGKDAFELVQKITPRSLQKIKTGQCYYAPICDENGGVLNDPMIIKLDDDHYWISIADSDVLLWVKALKIGLKMEVEVYEPDVSPLAVQGPQSDDLIARVFGEEATKTKFFRLNTIQFKNRDMFISRSGYSKQGGYEIYLNDHRLGVELWDALFDAGKDLNVQAGGPNLIERIEGGLLSYGNDITIHNTPFECNFDMYCDDDAMQECVGGEALQKHKQNIKQRIRGLIFQSNETLPSCYSIWDIIEENKKIGQVTSVAFSPDLNAHIAIGMLNQNHWDDNTIVTVHTPTGERQARVCQIPFHLN